MIDTSKWLPTNTSVIQAASISTSAGIGGLMSSSGVGGGGGGTVTATNALSTIATANAQINHMNSNKLQQNANLSSSNSSSSDWNTAIFNRVYLFIQTRLIMV